jgi:hypothetical protein
VLFSDYCISDALGLERSAHQALAATRMLAVYAEATSRDAMCLGSEFSMAYLTSKVPHSLVHTSAITVRRTLFDETGGFTPGMQVAEDYDLWSRCFAKGNCKTVLLLGDPQSVYFRWRGSVEKCCLPQRRSATSECLRDYTPVQFGVASDSTPDGARVPKVDLLVGRGAVLARHAGSCPLAVDGLLSDSKRPN